MLILLPLLHKLPLRARVIAARGLVALGVIGLIVGAVAVHGLVVASAIVLLMGLVVSGSVRRDTRRARRESMIV